MKNAIIGVFLLATIAAFPHATYSQGKIEGNRACSDAAIHVYNDMNNIAKRDGFDLVGLLGVASVDEVVARLYYGWRGAPDVCRTLLGLSAWDRQMFSEKLLDSLREVDK